MIKGIIINTIAAVVGGIIVLISQFLIIPWISTLSKSPEPIDITPEKFVTWYINIEKKTEAEELAKSRYYGKYVQWDGIIKDIQVISGVILAMWVVETPTQDDSVPIFASFKKKEDIDRLSVGMKIVVLCKLFSVHWGFPSVSVRLDECQLVKTKT